ncbi:MAG: ABC transporter ATP-binding protein [Eubacteriales bacterium]
MIEIKELSFRYEGAVNSSLNNVELRVEKGEFIVLTGASGCGKTTLTRILNGLCPQFYGGEVSGSYLLEGENAFSLTLSDIGLKIGNVFQDPRSQFYTRNTTDEILTSMEHRNFPRETMTERVQEICDVLQLDALLDRDIFQLSSGEKQKIAIASACVTKPEIVVLDEPSANLDGIGTKQLCELLYILKAQGVTIIVSEHRLHYLQDLFDKMVVMEEGQIKEVYSNAEANQLTSEQLIQMGLRLIQLPQEFTSTVSQESDHSLELCNLSFARQKEVIFTNISAKIPQGKITVVTGENGSGKTTLCKILCGLLKENQGEIKKEQRVFKKRERIKKCFFIGQDADYQLFCPTVWEEVLLNIKKNSEIELLATQMLEQLNLLELKDRHPVSLSGGQKQRVLLLAGILRKRNILILDEPTSGLDGKHMRIIAEILQDFSKHHQITILVITHDIEFGNMIADEVLYMEK